MHSAAFCVLDQRLSPRRRHETLDLLGATAIIDSDGRHPREGGRSVEDDTGLVMLTSGSSADPKAAQRGGAAWRAGPDMPRAPRRTGGPRVWFPCLSGSHIGGLAV